MSNVVAHEQMESRGVIWQSNVGTAKNDSAHAIAIDKAGHVYVAGEIAGYGSLNLSNADGFLAKFDEAGNQLWSQSIDISKSDSAYGVAVDGTGNIYVVGLQSVPGCLGLLCFVSLHMFNVSLRFDRGDG